MCLSFGTRRREAQHVSVSTRASWGRGGRELVKLLRAGQLDQPVLLDLGGGEDILSLGREDRLVEDEPLRRRAPEGRVRVEGQRHAAVGRGVATAAGALRGAREEASDDGATDRVGPGGASEVWGWEGVCERRGNWGVNGL